MYHSVFVVLFVANRLSLLQAHQGRLLAHKMHAGGEGAKEMSSFLLQCFTMVCIEDKGTKLYMGCVFVHYKIHIMVWINLKCALSATSSVQCPKGLPFDYLPIQRRWWHKIHCHHTICCYTTTRLTSRRCTIAEEMHNIDQFVCSHPLLLFAG